MYLCLMKTYTIYKLTSPSGKVYIGQTISITNRFSCYKNLLCEAQTLLYRSLIKYSWASFIKEIIETGLTKLEANELEIKLIKQFQDSNISLNIQRGGNLTKTPDKLCQFSLNGNFIKEWDSVEEACTFYNIKPTSVRVACKRKKNEQEGFLWLYKKDYDKGILPMKSNVKTREEIVQLKKSGEYIIIYKNLKQCLGMTKANRANIVGCLLKKQRSAGGFIFMYKSDYDEAINYSTTIRPLKKDSKTVIQYDLEWNYINEFLSLKLAEIATGVTKATISYICRNGDRKKNKNRKFLWKFKD